jgi:hypothetical protein
MTTLSGLPLAQAPSPASSFNMRTQNAAQLKITTLVYTGTDRFIIKRRPPSIGAIIPPLFKKKIVQVSKVDGIQYPTYIRDSPDAMPQAVPRTRKRKY